MGHEPRSPRIVVTVAVAARQAEPDLALRKDRLYADCVARHGATPVLLDATSTAARRRTAFAAMDGLLLSGGADVDPTRYGQPADGALGVEADRDALEEEAWAVAVARRRPVLGLCRGMQAINVFSGGTLLQHVPGHAGAAFGHGPAASHQIRLEPGSRLAGWVGGRPTLEVNSYHHQGIRPADLASGLVPSAWAVSAAGPLVEGLEAADGRFVVGVQCHPERTESTPADFEGLFAAFVEACRGAAARPLSPARGR
jgi:gamma-glutamyl-gamma-aminobutyrate hydrolase PuuD